MAPHLRSSALLCALACWLWCGLANALVYVPQLLLYRAIPADGALLFSAAELESVEVLDSAGKPVPGRLETRGAGYLAFIPQVPFVAGASYQVKSRARPEWSYVEEELVKVTAEETRVPTNLSVDTVARSFTRHDGGCCNGGSHCFYKPAGTALAMDAKTREVPDELTRSQWLADIVFDNEAMKPELWFHPLASEHVPKREPLDSELCAQLVIIDVRTGAETRGPRSCLRDSFGETITQPDFSSELDIATCHYPEPKLEAAWCERNREQCSTCLCSGFDYVCSPADAPRPRWCDAGVSASGPADGDASDLPQAPHEADRGCSLQPGRTTPHALLVGAIGLMLALIMRRRKACSES